MWITRGMFVPHIPPVTHTNPPPAHTTPGKVQGYSDSFSITEFFQKTRWETRIDPVSAIGLVGSESDIQSRVDEYREAGADEICLVPATASEAGGQKTLELMRSWQGVTLQP